ncbi:hypothetical protein DYH09_31140 [bacterium CPR1]|nr:hypothetical protein [bacterium CPR1]
MLDLRAVLLTGLLFFGLLALPNGVALAAMHLSDNVWLSKGLALLTALGGVATWIRLVPAMPGILQGMICINGLGVLLWSVVYWVALLLR